MENVACKDVLLQAAVFMCLFATSGDKYNLFDLKGEPEKFVWT